MLTWQRTTATSLLVLLLTLFSSSCTHNPITNEPIADSFEGCMGVNTGLGVLAGILVAKVTDSNAAGAAAFLGTVLISWQKCAQVHQKVVNTQEKSREEILAVRGAAGTMLRIDRLNLTVGPPGQDINSVVRYTVLADNPAKKDIPVKETRIVRVPKVVKDQQGRLFYADKQDKLLLDSAGKPMPADGKTRHDLNSLVYDDLAFPVDNIVKQGMRKADGLLPTPNDMPDNLPYRFRFIVEAEGQRAEKEVDFRFSKPGQAATTFAAQGASNSTTPTLPTATREKQSAEHTAEVSPVAADGWSGAVKKTAQLRDTPGGKSIGQISPGTLFVAIEDMTEGAKDTQAASWIRVRTESGAIGWLRKTDIKGLK